MSQPLVKTIGGNQAPAKFQRIAERGFRSRCFRPRIDHACGNGRVSRPRGNESPAHQRQFPHRLLRILADNGDRLGGGDVVPRAPIWFVASAIEVFLDNLLPPRKFVTTAHGENYGRTERWLVVGGTGSFPTFDPNPFNANSICSRWCSLWEATFSNSSFSVRTPVSLWTNSR